MPRSLRGIARDCVLLERWEFNLLEIVIVLLDLAGLFVTGVQDNAIAEEKLLAFLDPHAISLFFVAGEVIHAERVGGE